MGRPADSNGTNDETLTVRDNRTGKTYTIPIKDNAVSATAFKAISAPLRPGERAENETPKGLRVSDRGFLNTAVIQSEITYIDGEAGVLRYRGYPIEQLALRSTHLETAYLLIYGTLPAERQLRRFESEVIIFFRSFRYDAHPMAILTSAFSYLGSYYGEANPSLQGQKLFTQGDRTSLANMDRQIFRIIGKATSLAAMAYRVRQGREVCHPAGGALVYRTPTTCFASRFLYQMDHLGQENYKPSPVLEKALDILFLLHADHELNASCTTVLQTGSSLVDPYSAVAAGCASLYASYDPCLLTGQPGGANEAVIRMLITIGSPENVPAFLEAVKRRERVLSGFGHRVYKTSDPRSFIIRKTADDVFKETGKDELLETAMALHDAAIKDEYFVQRRLAPNVDFCGLIYRAMGFPLDFFPVLFAVPRVVGWLAHWRQACESMWPHGHSPTYNCARFTLGQGRRDYVPVGERLVVEGLKAEPLPVAHSGMSKRTVLAEFTGKSKL
ncbi:peroxysomal citrate synthase [Russula earlei]|uniref:Peroxysomal citrate synthase n=1 Tax=Russula earlei TaxID=71964 RepID=A0ACC0UKN7_9AGAM|nr:peroxysomal citrate synthase [Russula earlei]